MTVIAAVDGIATIRYHFRTYNCHAPIGKNEKGDWVCATCGKDWQDASHRWEQWTIYKVDRDEWTDFLDIMEK